MVSTPEVVSVITVTPVVTIVPLDEMVVNGALGEEDETIPEDSQVEALDETNGDDDVLAEILEMTPDEAKIRWSRN